MKHITLILGLALSVCGASTAATAAEAWQCGRDYLQVNGREATIWPNKKGPIGNGEEYMLNQADQPQSRREAGLPPSPYRWKESNLYYRGKACKPVN
jgi:hypothetical protein